MVAIADYEMGNLFSVKQACEHVGLDTCITADPASIDRASALILPGVGAFGDAMTCLKERELDTTIVAFAASGRPVLGICLGMQLLVTESFEFGWHAGLNLVPGKVIRFNPGPHNAGDFKVPQVQWNKLLYPPGLCGNLWTDTLLEGVSEGEFMYFVHSYYVVPEHAEDVLATTRYGDVEFCSVLRHGNIFAFQGHPERSGRTGLRVYRNLANLLKQS
jgi:glutamine amidotransferase